MGDLRRTKANSKGFHQTEKGSAKNDLKQKAEEHSFLSLWGTRGDGSNASPSHLELPAGRGNYAEEHVTLRCISLSLRELPLRSEFLTLSIAMDLECWFFGRKLNAQFRNVLVPEAKMVVQIIAIWFYIYNEFQDGNWAPFRFRAQDFIVPSISCLCGLNERNLQRIANMRVAESETMLVPPFPSLLSSVFSLFCAAWWIWRDFGLRFSPRTSSCIQSCYSFRTLKPRNSVQYFAFWRVLAPPNQRASLSKTNISLKPLQGNGGGSKLKMIYWKKRTYPPPLLCESSEFRIWVGVNSLGLEIDSVPGTRNWVQKLKHIWNRGENLLYRVKSVFEKSGGIGMLNKRLATRAGYFLDFLEEIAMLRFLLLFLIETR